MNEENVVKEGLSLIPEDSLYLEIRDKSFKNDRKYFQQRMLKHLYSHTANSK